MDLGFDVVVTITGILSNLHSFLLQLASYLFKITVF